MTRWLAALSVTFAAALAAPAQLPPEKALATMKPADGFHQKRTYTSSELMLPHQTVAGAVPSSIPCG